MIVWNHGKKHILIVQEFEADQANWKDTICVSPGQGIDLELLQLRPERPVKGPRQQAVERLDAMAGRDEGGIMPPRDPMSIDRRDNRWWKSRHEMSIRMLTRES